MHRIDVHKLADEAKFNSFHRSVLIWCFVILVLDGYDLAVAGTALPSIMKAMNVEAATAGFMASSALFGMMFGAIALGALADKIGRRWAISICVFLFCVFTAAAGFTNDPITFSVMRFLAGLGIGGAIPNAAAQMTEYSPKKVRGLMVTLMCCGYAVGSILAALLGKQFIEIYGWQSVFMAAGAPVVLIPFIVKYMPESLPFLIKQHDDTQLREVVRKIRPDMRIEPHAVFHVPAEDKATDRARPGSKHHVATDANGKPIAAILTGANRHDVTQLIPLIEAIVPIGGMRGRPLSRPGRIYADRGYDHDKYRRILHARNIPTSIARRGQPHGSGLGRVRWVVERTHARLHNFRRLRIRFERRADIHEAFLKLGCCLICWNTLLRDQQPL